MHQIGLNPVQRKLLQSGRAAHIFVFYQIESINLLFYCAHPFFETLNMVFGK